MTKLVQFLNLRMAFWAHINLIGIRLAVGLRPPADTGRDRVGRGLPEGTVGVALGAEQHEPRPPGDDQLLPGIDQFQRVLVLGLRMQD